MTKDKDDSSWRDTLFVWDGILVASDDNDDKKEKDALKWEGTWVGTDNKDSTQIDAPKRGAFDELVASDMHFHVTGTSSEEMDGFYIASFTQGPGWDLKSDGEEEKKKHSDDAHDILMENLKWTGNLENPTANLLFATGNNEFGTFVSAGWMRPGNRLTLARRYLDDGDERSDWSLQELRKAVIEEAVVNGKARIPPWQCSVLNSEYNSKKRSLENEGDNDKQEGDKKQKDS